MNTTDQAIEEKLVSLGFSLESSLTSDDFDGFNGDNHWEVTIKKGEGSLNTKYSQGCAHRHYPRPTFHAAINVYTNKEAYDKLPISPIQPAKGRTVREASDRKSRTVPTPPDLVSVMHCLTSDCSSVMSAGSFEDWCEELEYSDDSIIAKEAYECCQASYFKLNAMGVDFEEMNEIFQDY